jgi:aspartyl-tRNA(Asn)/glutamyl-tRNA(Gln) amidotransferase subunit B
MDYYLTVGLEIHTQLNTKTKLWCSCSNNSFQKPANTNICPICTAQPGSLPSLNQAVIKKAVLLGKSINAKINLKTKFDRKSYFYPDNPAGYQITQYTDPILSGGEIFYLDNFKKKKLNIERVHIENDAGKMIHTEKESLLDLNRAGSPLFEIVSKPELKSIKEVSSFLKELQKILRYLDVSQADMEKGMMRADVNISVSKDFNKLGNRIEIKNMNSFSEIEKAIKYEYQRQINLLEKGIKFEPETRGFDLSSGKTFLQRSKENAADYRYFPENDLAPLLIDEKLIQEISKSELPLDKYEEFINKFKLSPEEALKLTEEKEMIKYFEKTYQKIPEPQKIANLILSEILALMKEKHLKINEQKITPNNLAEIISMLKQNKISSKIAKNIIKECFETGDNPSVIAKEKNLIQNSNLEELEKICEDVLTENQKIVDQFLAGKTKVFGALVGKTMQKTQGKANPALVNDILTEKLKK